MPCRFKSGFGYQIGLYRDIVEQNKLNKDQSDLISLKEFFSILFKYRLTILVVVTVFAMSSVIYSLSLPNKFTSEISLKVMLNQDSQQSNRIGGISSLIGMNLNNANSESEILKSMILSNSFARNLIKYEGISEKIIAAKRYDIKTGEIIFDKNEYDQVTSEWIRDVSYPFKKVPSYLEVYEAYSDDLKVTIDESSGLMEISYTHISPNFSKYFVDLIVQEVNSVMKTRDNMESSKSLDYLNKELSTATKLEVRKAIGSLVETQLKKDMLLNISDEYALSTVNASFIPELKSSPNRAFICILGTFIGFFISIILVMIRQFTKDNVKQP